MIGARLPRCGDGQAPDPSHISLSGYLRMSSPQRPIAGVSKSRGRYSRLSRVFLMSGLGAIVLGAAFWPPQAVQRRLAVRLTFSDGLSEAERQEKLAEIQAAVIDQVELAHWAADADVEAKPRPFVFAKLAAVLPKAVRAEDTLSSSPIESDGNVSGVELTFADSDGLRAERFAQAIIRTFDACSAGSLATAESNPIARDPANSPDREKALASIRREQDELRKALDDHFEELRALQSNVSGKVGSDKKDEPGRSTAGSAATPDRAELSRTVFRVPNLATTTRSNVLWQVSPSESMSDVERQLAALDADIAAKKAAQEELLSKFTAHHPVATALGIAIERLVRERRELAELIDLANESQPAPATQPVPPLPVVLQPTITRPEASPAPSAPVRSSYEPTVTVSPEPTPAPAAEPADDEAAKQAAAAEVAANQQAVVASLERAIRSEKALQEELRSLAEASELLASPSSSSAAVVQPGLGNMVESVPSMLHAEIVELAPTERVESRFALLAAGSLFFACLMTGLTWVVSRERAIASADEVRLASGLPVVGQSAAGLLDRKPKRNLASVAVVSSLKLVEGAAFATAVFCVAALAAENPRCEQILRQPLAIAWQALQSLT